ncbi:FAD-dependent oxidoreductase [Chlorobium sp. BLA1]|uniref:NAD(P)/FAD-dependent oxidoreductase n=1 Tax=Candidatus Chlorobium masyuteum TaxID=2716876 RepID=UPI001423A906|nr:FAD-dependent oxidoreductase [Candidatus Chlorobium masyuteum]NHQ61144.1 FAD-dependent oxidoreductase [Candidatus Chlorobium masyuteum]
MHKVLILGGGIGGVAAAIALRKQGVAVELVSERDYLFIYPLAIWIPTGGAQFRDIGIPLSKLARKHGFSLTIDKVIALDSERKTVTLEKTGVRDSAAFVVIALGASKMKHDGIEHTTSICGKPEDSLVLKAKIEALIERGSGSIAFGFGGNPNDPSAVRGGPGFELFFNLHHHLTKLGIRERFEMTFFAPMAEPGARMGKRAFSAMAAMFEADNFTTRYGKKISRFEPDGIVFEDRSRLKSDLCMFIPASDGHETVRRSNLPQNSAGFIRIDDYCRIEGVRGWYAVGDAAALEGPEWKAKQGHLAELMAHNAAVNASVEHFGRKEKMRGYQDHLNILCVMDTGDGAGFVFKNSKRELFIPLPVVGHWLKKSWGHYYKLSKLWL